MFEFLSVYYAYIFYLDIFFLADKTKCGFYGIVSGNGFGNNRTSK